MVEVERTKREERLPEGGEEQRSERQSDPSQKDVENFQSAMGRNSPFALGAIAALVGAGRDGGGSVGGAVRRKRPFGEGQSSADGSPASADLLPVAAFVPPAVPLTGAAGKVAPLPPRTFREIVRQLVSHITTNGTALDQGKEVVVGLKDPLFGGSQVRISRNGNELSIIFIAQNSQQADLVSQHQGQLRAALIERIKLDEVHIRSQVRDGEGGVGAGGGEGRSRGQRNSQEEYERNEELQNPFALGRRT
ncbi:MAG: hypothetical protein LBB14_00170 [Puniceicoccales bacterium]|jgi:flagellar hook-length control protein FliK|nr:hypothetical protein [Puniceicoccales bacterium]